MITLWTGFKQQNCASENNIGPNEEEVVMRMFNIHQISRLKSRIKPYQAPLLTNFRQNFEIIWFQNSHNVYNVIIAVKNVRY